MVARDINMNPVHANQPLSSIEAFALALVEASSRLTAAAPANGDAGTLAAPYDDEPVPAAE